MIAHVVPASVLTHWPQSMDLDMNLLEGGDVRGCDKTGQKFLCLVPHPCRCTDVPMVAFTWATRRTRWACGAWAAASSSSWSACSTSPSSSTPRAVRSARRSIAHKPNPNTADTICGSCGAGKYAPALEFAQQHFSRFTGGNLEQVGRLRLCVRVAEVYLSVRAVT
jgi:hypothetical protein